MHRIDEDGEMLRVHVGVDTMAEVGDVALRVEVLNHGFREAAKLLLGCIQGTGVQIPLQSHGSACQPPGLKINMKYGKINRLKRKTSQNINY